MTGIKEERCVSMTCRRRELNGLSRYQKTWPQLQTAITKTIHTSQGQEELRLLSEDMATEFKKAETTLNEICAKTCTSCSELCCIRATVWYDLKDLLFFYLHTGTFPARQISRNRDGVCAQLTPSGCSAPRANRPFICTWYICASQKDLIKNLNISQPGREVIATIKKIQSQRKELEDIFFSGVSS